ncbi:unnamed protein product [Penicillium bialowiezense]
MSTMKRSALDELITRENREQYASQLARDELSQPLSYYEESEGHTLVIGGKRYGILKSHIQKYPLLIEGDIHGAAGHTVVHFLYTGTYETIDSPVDGGYWHVTFEEQEFQKNVYVYQASRSCNIPDLTKLALEHIGEHSRGVPTPEILHWTAKIFPNLPKDERGLQSFVGEVILRRSAKIGHLKPGVDSPSLILDKNNPFRKALSGYFIDYLHSTTECLQLIGDESACELAKNLPPRSQLRSVSKKRPAPE